MVDYNTKCLDGRNYEFKGNAFICSYIIQYVEKMPYLMYLLEKNNDEFKFPQFRVQDSNFYFDVETKLQEISESNIIFKGTKILNDNLYVFYQIQGEFHPEIMTKNDIWWFATIFEILYENMLLQKPIHKSVSNIFIQHSNLMYLTDNDKIIETPIVCFIGENKNEAMTVFNSGPIKSEIDNNFVYVFSSLSLALRNSCWNDSLESHSVKKTYYNDLLETNINGSYKKGGGIVRYVVFLGELNVDYGRVSFSHYDRNNVFYYSYYVYSSRQFAPITYHEIKFTRNFDYKINYDIII